jgi:ribosome-binding protein aMBF1 (putative translation factor)
MSTVNPTATRHHPSWREVRDGFLADPEVQASYEELAPRFVVVRQLIALREQRGWSQRELADRAGMKQPQLARLETGQVEPRLDTLQRLAKAMGCEVHVSFQPAAQRSATAEPMLR